MTALEFRRDLWRQKTRRIALSCGVKISPVGFWISHKARVRQTDGRSDRQNYHSQDRASIAASRGKNRFLLSDVVNCQAQFLFVISECMFLHIGTCVYLYYYTCCDFLRNLCNLCLHFLRSLGYITFHSSLCTIAYHCNF